MFCSYRGTLLDDRRRLLERFRYAARKVVGVGRVGTRVWILLLRGRDDGDPVVPPTLGGRSSALRTLPPARAIR